jgi:ribose transport system permease protein
MKKDIGIAILLLVLCGVASYLNPRFLYAYNLQNNARLIGMFGIFSIGVGVVIITGGIDLSIGSVFALEGVLLATMLRGGVLSLLPAMFKLPALNVTVPQISWPLAVCASIVFLCLLGVIHALLIVKVKLQPFIVTLCGLLIYRGAARFTSSEETRGFGESKYGILRGVMTGYPDFDIPYYSFQHHGLAQFHVHIPIPMPFIIMLIVAVVMAIVIHKSVYGRYLFAVGRNEDAARYSGINSRLVIGSAYVVCMLLTGIAGIILALDTNTISPSSFGSSYELTGIAAAVLGGCSLRGGEGSVLGIVIGTALLVVLQNIVNLLGIDSSLNNAVMGGVILAGVLVDQLLAQRRKRKINSPVGPPPGAFPVVPLPSQPAGRIEADRVN